MLNGDMYLYLALATLVAAAFVHLSHSETKTLYFGSVPPPAPEEKFDKRHWLESAMPRIEDRCPEKGAKESKCQTFEVSGYVYHYEFAPLPKSPDGQVLVNFSVRTEHDAFISLVVENNDLPDMYEIVIGEWFDTASVIRKCKHGPCNKASVNSPDGWLDSQTYKHFWVNATPGTSQGGTETMTISVGRGSDENPFMEYTDPSPLPVNYVGFSGWNGISGSFKFCNLDLKY